MSDLLSIQEFTSGKTIDCSPVTEDVVPGLISNGKEVILNYNRGVNKEANVLIESKTLILGENNTSTNSNNVLLAGKNNNVSNSNNVSIIASENISLDNSNETVIMARKTEEKENFDGFKETIIARNIMLDGRLYLGKIPNKIESKRKESDVILEVNGLTKISQVLVQNELDTEKINSKNMVVSKGIIDNIDTKIFNFKINTEFISFLPIFGLDSNSTTKKNYENVIDLDLKDGSFFIIDTSKQNYVFRLNGEYEDGLLINLKIIDVKNTSNSITLISDKYYFETEKGTIDRETQFSGNFSLRGYSFSKKLSFFVLRYVYEGKVKAREPSFPAADIKQKSKLFSL